MSGRPGPRTAAGRPPMTSGRRLEQVALRLFAEQGFDETTVDDIAAEAGIGRRTFFRYYGSKNDVVWGDFTAGLGAFRRALELAPPTMPLVEALTDAVVLFNRFDPEAATAHRQRMALILRVPALQAHSTLRYAQWREVVAEYAAARLQVAPSSLQPQLVGYAALAAAVTAYEQWLQDEQADLSALLRTCLTRLGQGLETRS